MFGQTVDVNQPPVAGNNVVDSRQAKPCPLAAFGGKKRLKGTRTSGGVHTAAVVFDGEKYARQGCLAAVFRYRTAHYLNPAVTGFDFDLPSAGHGVTRIKHEIEKDLLRLSMIHFDQTQAGVEVKLELDIFSDQPEQKTTHPFGDLIQR
jgi:hypothetical protein